MTEGHDSIIKSDPGKIVEVSLGKRRVRFYSLTKPDVEGLVRDILDMSKINVKLSVSISVLVTLIVECLVTDFTKLPTVGQAVMYIGIPFSLACTIVFGVIWFKTKKPVRDMVSDRIDEIHLDEPV